MRAISFCPAPGRVVRRRDDRKVEIVDGEKVVNSDANAGRQNHEETFHSSPAAGARRGAVWFTRARANHGLRHFPKEIKLTIA